jgi:ABC-2 type transport system permease protein
MSQFFTIVKVLLKSRFSFAFKNKNRARNGAIPNARRGNPGVNNSAAAAGANAPAAAGMLYAQPVRRNNAWVLYMLMGLGYVMLIGMLCLAVAVVTPYAAAAGALPALNLTIYLIVMLFVLFMGIFGMLTYVYLNRDAEFLATLPVKGRTLFLAKLTVVYCGELGLSAGIILPLCFTLGFAAHLGVLYFISVLLAVLFVPALPMLFAALLSIPLMYAVSFFKNKSTMTSIVVILLTGAVFGLYYSVMFSVQTGDGGGAAAEDGLRDLTESMRGMGYALYPVYALIEFGMLLPVFGLPPFPSALLALLFSLSGMALAVFLSGLISNKVYIRSAAAQLESKRGGKARTADFKSGGVTWALLKKEWRTMLRETAFAFQCLFGTMVGVIITALTAAQYGNFSGMLTTGEDAVAIDGETLRFVYSAVIFTLIMMFSAGMNVAAATGISREGKNFYIMKLMPVPYTLQLRAKLYLSLIIGFIGAAAAFIAGTVIMKTPIAEAALEAVVLALLCYCMACFSLKFDLLSPKLDWVTPTQAVKNTRGAIVPPFVGMGAAIVLGTLIIVLGLFLHKLAGLALVAVILAVLLPFLHRWLFRRTEWAFDCVSGGD